MECNKEEAFRAKAIAEKKMQDKDFVGARKFALKAQQLYPDMENISQMICVCDVHCSAEKKIFVNELDWYGILQIELTADEALIKKQYRKFALLLHPDKNKFAGAEAAFKLIGEAQRVLLDKDKRSFYDLNYKRPCKPAVSKQASHQVSKSFNIVRQSTAQNNPRNNQSHQEPKQKAQSGAANGKETFWTVCPFCSVRYQYYKEVLNRALRCQSCQKPFIAYDMHAQSAGPGTAATHPVFPRQNAPNVGASKGGPETMNKKPASSPGSQSEQNTEFGGSREARKSHRGVDKVDEEGELESKSSGKANGKRGKKQVVESSESFESDNSLDMEGIEVNGDTLRAQRRSARTKRRVIYNESGSDDEVAVNLSKRTKGSGSSSPVMEKHSDASGTEQPSEPSKPIGSGSASVKEETKGGFNKSVGGETVVEPIKKNFGADNGCTSDSSPETTLEPTFHEYPDPEFCDFDKDREERCFKVGQVWAAYDTVDAMPRFYARIRKIFSPGFKVRITWFEPDPDDEDGTEWADAELPFSCGKFKNGDSENTEDRLMFSHLVSWEKGSDRDSVMIYPRKGETWALFKNWNAKWYLIPENERKLEFEFVEVLSEYQESIGICVACLGKLKGFASLFCRKGGNEVQIQPSEILRFSHRVPSYRMTGNERKDVPPGSYELDPAAITMNFEEITHPKQDVKPFVIDLTSSFDEANHAEKFASDYRNNVKGNKVEHVNELHGGVNGQDIPDPEFFNFDGLKSPHKFKLNQIWALYSDIDGFPKYYGLIKKINPQPNFAVHVAWLEACYPPPDMILWKDKKVPISCGPFKVRGGKPQRYTVFTSFSHELRVVADPKGRKNVFSIYPQEGDVWALYKNWHPNIAHSNLNDTEYDIVEVLDTNPLQFKVLVLEPAQAFKAVFKPQKNGSSIVTKEIRCAELLRFSHKIPSFRLTDERGGHFRGFLELDTAALPDQFIYRKK